MDAVPEVKAPKSKVTISSSGSVAPSKRIVRDDPHPPVEEKAPPRPASQRAARRRSSGPAPESGKPARLTFGQAHPAAAPAAPDATSPASGRLTPVTHTNH